MRFHIAASPGPAAIVAAEAAAVQRRTGQYSATGGGVPSSPRQPISPRLSGPEELVSDRWRDREQYGAAESTGALRLELQSMRLKTLRQRAREHGVGESVMAFLADSDDPKEAVIELLLLTEREKTEREKTEKI